MDERLLGAMMEGIDPARDLSDAVLDELLPEGRLMESIVRGIESGETTRGVARIPMWRRIPTLIAAGAAAVTVAVAASLTLLSSTPAVVHATSLEQSTNGHKSIQFGPVATAPAFTSQSAVTVLNKSVHHDRFVSTVVFDDGAFSVSPAPASMKTPTNAKAIEKEIWATSQLQGYSKWRAGSRTPSFGYGIVTIVRNEAGVQVITKQAAWVGLARENAMYHCPLETSGQSTKSLQRRAPSSGLAAVAVGEPTGAPAVVYVARSVRCGRLYPAVVTNASEELSLPWKVLGGVVGSKLTVEVTPPPCGHIAGSAVAATMHAGSLSSVTITEYGTVPEDTLMYQACPVSSPVREVIDLGGPVSPHTTFNHETTGPVVTVAEHSK